MKNFMRVISGLIAFTAIIILIFNIVEPKYGTDFYKFGVNVLYIFKYNQIPIISIALCAYCLERNDRNILVRIIPVYMSIPIFLCILLVLFESTNGVMYDIYSFLQSTFSAVFVLSIILLVKPTNRITNTIRIIAFAIIAVNAGLTIFSNVKSYLVDNLPDKYGYSTYREYTYSSTKDTNEFVEKVYSITSSMEIFILLLLFTTNYAFSDKDVLIEEDIDYETVKSDAIKMTNLQMQQKYRPVVEATEPDRSASEKGLMNVNNQLGNNSNVGVVKEKASKVNVSGSTLESLMPLSSGPVINSVMNTDNQVEETTPVEETLPPNLDIQEQMKMKVQQSQQTPAQQDIQPQQNNINNQ